jgi:hypothetical protein
MQQETPKLSQYQQVAETVGMVPSLNARDNLIQGAFVGLVTILAFIMGHVTGGAQTALVFMLAGLISSGLISGVVLMVVGMVRVARQQKR